MTEQEIRDNKPDGATHYDSAGDYWKIVSDTVSYFYCSMANKWIRYAFDHNEGIADGYIKPL